MSKISPSFVGLVLALAVAQRSCSCTSALVLRDTAAPASVGHPASATRTSFVSTPFLPRLHKRTLAMTQADSGATSPVQAAPSDGDSTAEGESIQRYGSKQYSSIAVSTCYLVCTSRQGSFTAVCCCVRTSQTNVLVI